MTSVAVCRAMSSPRTVSYSGRLQVLIEGCRRCGSSALPGKVGGLTAAGIARSAGAIVARVGQASLRQRSQPAIRSGKGLLFGVSTSRCRLHSNLGREARPAPGKASGRVESLAVLALEDLSHDPAQEYFADGLTEALITSLAQISASRVTSRTTDHDLQECAQVRSGDRRSTRW